ncbi:hypothetical protein ICY20_13665 [Pseudomonas sp. P115]|uniref:NEL-type E3 ubiquitin ligase domain-containing protein n=1 Tax=Pseudomonas pisciculturae TaxID=2730413 RepID=UPI001891F7F5|nr:NEL-type E3 ubiquitin ligase domain-containing protein [Pseudomonas pisciculturae]MBF6028787.1 hypothetical protein [Pseudomonas pisciculturae]
MVEPIISTAPQDSLSVFMAQQRGPLMAGQEWAALQALDSLRPGFDSLLEGLNEQEKRDYLDLQRAWIDNQKTLEQAIRQFTTEFEQRAKASLRTELRALTGQDIDPEVAKINTRYLKPSGRVRREYKGDEEVIERATLWDAACMNYDGLTGWSVLGTSSFVDASYLDSDINATASQFIALVRRLNIGGQLKTRLSEALLANGSLGSGIMGLAKAEFEFALIEALRDTTASRVDRDKYQCVRRALVGEMSWNVVEEMQLFIPHGVDNVSWIPETIGLTGQYIGQPPGDKLVIAHIVFSVKGCKGAFSFLPNRPGGALRHHSSHREACESFYVSFRNLYSNGQIEWLYQVMLLRDSARLKQIVKTTPLRHDAHWLEKLVHSLAQALPKTIASNSIGYVRNSVQKTPVSSLSDFYVKRSQANLQELANQTPGFMATLIELFKSLINEILNVLLIPVPGALKGLGRIRAFAMFYAMEQALVEGGQQAMLGEPGELLQGFADLADLLISGRIHTRLAYSVQRRHQRLYRQLSLRHGATPTPQQLSSPQILERMLAAQDVPARKLEALLDASSTSRQTLNQIWDGAPASASLIEAVDRYRVDRLIDWVADGADPGRPVPVGAVDVIAPLLVRMDNWPASTSLSIENHQGQEIRRYSKNALRPATSTVTVAVQENHQFAYAAPRRYTAHLPQAIVELLPTFFTGGQPLLRQQLATQAKALRLELFVALTRFAGASRAVVKDVSASVHNLLPDSVGSEHQVPAVVTQLQALHPELSRVRLLEVLREHPLSEHQQTQLLDSKLQPEALYNALRGARQVARWDAIIDGIFHPRRFSQKTQSWAAEFAHGVLNDGIGRPLVVSPAGQLASYVSGGAADRTIVVIDQLRGDFSSFDHRDSRTGPTLSGADSFYEAIVSQLSDADRLGLGLNALRAIDDLRHLVARAMLLSRAPDGSFYPCRREIERYASPVEKSLINPEPHAQGLYRLGADRYLLIEGECFKVAEQPWRIQHPSLHDAYAPLLTHNGAGAWRHEWENPLTWDGQKLFYRLEPLAQSFSLDVIEQIQHVSGVTPGILRRVHMRNERPPAVLRETIERFTVHQRIKAGVEVGRDFFDELLGEVGPERADVLVGHPGMGRVEQIDVLESRVAADQPHMERLFFKVLCHKSELSTDPLAQVLQRHFPSLTAAIAEDLLRDITASERLKLQAGHFPPTLMPDVRWWIDYLRKTKALEGVYLPAAESEGSSRLILHALPDIEGWSSHLRVEVWERGHLIDSVGPADATLQRVLVSVSGHYEAYIPQANGARQSTGRPGAFLAVLLDALPTQERQALRYTHDELKLEIDHRLRRNMGFAAFSQKGRLPMFKPPRRQADDRIGYPLSGGDDLGPADREQVARVRELFPAKTDEQARSLLLDVGDSVSEREGVINYLINERNVMNNALQQWRDEASASDAGIASARSRALAVARIQRCWAKEGFTPGVVQELNLDDLDLASLPTLHAHFGHVTMLSVNSNRLTDLPPNFIRCFPGLRVINFNGNQFSHLPDFEGAPQLAVLNLSNNRLKFTLRDELRLAALTNLRTLDLSANPLGQGRQLSLYRLKQLRDLNLRNCGLDRMPRGAVTLATLRNFDLRDNQIRVLSESDLFILPKVHQGMNLRGNPLYPETQLLLRRVGARYGRPSADFGLWQPPESLDQSATRWLALLPGTEVRMRQHDWATLQEHAMTDYFFELLGCIASDPGFIDRQFQALRENVTQRVWTLIDEALFHGRMELIAISSAYRYLNNDNLDSWLLCLHELELNMLPQRMLAGDVQSAGPGFLRYYRALRRLDSLSQQISRYFDPQESWQACTRILSYRIALAPSLELPLVLPGRFDEPTEVPDAHSVYTLRQNILRQEDGWSWPAHVQHEPDWVEFLERKYAQRFTSELKEHDRSLQRATDKVEKGLMTEGAYLNHVRTLQAARQTAKDELIRQLTLEEWNEFVIG